MRKLVSLLAVALLSCSTYQDHLQRGHRLFQENEFEHALAVWRTLEPEMKSLSWEEQARYSYLRGMTDYRLGFKRDARHWLAIAKAIDAEHPGGLSGDWPKRTESALSELNRDVFGNVYGVTDSEAIEHPVLLGEDLGSSTNAPRSQPATERPAGPAQCRSEADCPANAVCLRGQCSEN